MPLNFMPFSLFSANSSMNWIEKRRLRDADVLRGLPGTNLELHAKLFARTRALCGLFVVAFRTCGNSN